MESESLHFGYESMGTHWEITVWDAIASDVWGALQEEIRTASEHFDRTYSRFIDTSLVWELTRKTGIVAVPEDFTAMLRLYERFFDLSGGKFTPLIAVTLSDLGYDKQSSFAQKAVVRTPPDFRSTVRIVDDTHVELREKLLFDFGGLGKGFFVDRIASFLKREHIRRFLVNGSGDMFYKGDGQTLRVGLEHPKDPEQVVGVIELMDGAICGSGSTRRTWNGKHHIVDPFSLKSPAQILATWVTAQSTVIADGLATCLFLMDPDRFARSWPFEYCILDDAFRVKRSSGFRAELF